MGWDARTDKSFFVGRTITRRLRGPVERDPLLSLSFWCLSDDARRYSLNWIVVSWPSFMVWPFVPATREYDIVLRCRCAPAPTSSRATNERLDGSLWKSWRNFLNNNIFPWKITRRTVRRRHKYLLRSGEDSKPPENKYQASPRCSKNTELVTIALEEAGRRGGGKREASAGGSITTKRNETKRNETKRNGTRRKAAAGLLEKHPPA